MKHWRKDVRVVFKIMMYSLLVVGGSCNYGSHSDSSDCKSGCSNPNADLVSIRNEINANDFHSTFHRSYSYGNSKVEVDFHGDSVKVKGVYLFELVVGQNGFSKKILCRIAPGEIYSGSFCPSGGEVLYHNTWGGQGDMKGCTVNSSMLLLPRVPAEFLDRGSLSVQYSYKHLVEGSHNVANKKEVVFELDSNMTIQSVKIFG